MGTKLISIWPRFLSAGVGFLPYLLTFKMGSIDIPHQDSIRQKDEQLLATLGYKQEFKRAFAPLEVIDFWPRYSKIWLICGGLWYRLLHHWIITLNCFSPFLCHPKWRRPSDGVGGESHHVYLWISLTLSSVVGSECIRIVYWRRHGRACVSCSNFWWCTYDFKFCCLSDSESKINSSIFGPIHWLLRDGEMFYAGSLDVRSSSLPMQAH